MIIISKPKIRFKVNDIELNGLESTLIDQIDLNQLKKNWMDYNFGLYRLESTKIELNWLESAKIYLNWLG